MHYLIRKQREEAGVNLSREGLEDGGVKGARRDNKLSRKMYVVIWKYTFL